MEAINNYVNLNLSDKGELLAALHESVKIEARSDTIGLIGADHLYGARQPGLLTQGMAAWFAKYIAPSRVAAIGEMKSAFESDRTETGKVAGVYLENKRDSARQKTVNAAIDKAMAFADRHGNAVAEHEATAEAFKNLRARAGREPVRTNTWLYVACLLLVVLLEAFINFESFLRVPYITSPFLATGATIAVGVGVGCAAHLHGIVYRQWVFLFHPQESAEAAVENRRQDALRRLAIGFTLLSIALLMVGGARYYYLRDYILEAELLGKSKPSMAGGIFFMLLGNVIAYFVGVVIAYFMHDPHPIYAEQDRKLRKSTKHMEKLKKERGQVQDDLNRGLNAEITSAVNHDSSARGLRYDELRRWADRIVNKDQEVIGALIQYREALLRELGTRAQGRIFRFPRGGYDQLLPVSDHQMMNGAEYASRSLTLGYDL